MNSFRVMVWALLCLISLGIMACAEEEKAAAPEPVCSSERPVCDPGCGDGEVCNTECACEPIVCDPQNPICNPTCGEGEVCNTACACEEGRLPTTCDPAQPSCDPECGEGEFCDRDCTCSPVLCDAQNPVCDPGCGENEFCTSACTCAPVPCDPQNPVCDPGCTDGQTCDNTCSCVEEICDPQNPVCDPGCGDGEFCNVSCACEALCDAENPVCPTECGENQACGNDCECHDLSTCNPDRPVCDPPCPDGKLCGANCECTGACNPEEPTCFPACNSLEVCNDSCMCEPKVCDPENPVCDPGCADGEVCSQTCFCEPPPACDPQNPVCEPGCGEGEFCARNCGCYPDGTELPDLIVDTGSLRNSLYIEEREFADNSCALAEGCIEAPGYRRLLRFDTTTPNIGNADMYMGTPSDNADLFEFSACHAHYHFNGYAEYQLLDNQGRVAARGHKQAFCLLDSRPYVSGEDVPASGQYNCGNQGITRGWADVYGSGLDCQWIDITDVEPGVYTVKVSLNNFQTIEELSFDNNIGTAEVIIPAADPLGSCDFQSGNTGEGRDCGWEIAGSYECSPGDPVAVACANGCGLGSCSGDAMLRVCEGENQVCTGWQALGNSDNACGGLCPLNNIVCPDSGKYTVLSGSRNPGGTYTCEISSQVGHIRDDPTDPCASEANGLARDCGWSQGGSWFCEPGQDVTLGCNTGDGCGLGQCSGDSMLRICDGHGERCLHEDRLAENDDACGNYCSQVTFECPESGVFSTLHGPFRTTQEYSCEPQATGAGHCPSDQMEPNHDPEQTPLLSVGRVEDLSVCRGEAEFYGVFATEVDTIDLSFNFEDESAEMHVQLFDPTGEVVAEGMGASPGVSLSYRVEEGGRFRVSARLVQGDQANYSVSLELYDTP